MSLGRETHDLSVDAFDLEDEDLSWFLRLLLFDEDFEADVTVFSAEIRASLSSFRVIMSSSSESFIPCRFTL
jgi:hypothetical protein